MIHKELERAKCICADEGFEVDCINQYQVRATKKEAFFIDLWASFTKGRNFKGYTILRWSDKTYHRNIWDLGKWIQNNR